MGRAIHAGRKSSAGRRCLREGVSRWGGKGLQMKTQRGRKATWRALCRLSPSTSLFASANLLFGLAGCAAAICTPMHPCSSPLSPSTVSLATVEAWQGSSDEATKTDASAALKSERVRGREGARERGRRQFAVQATSSCKVKKPPLPKEKGKGAFVAGLGAGAMLDAIIATHLSAGGGEAGDTADLKAPASSEQQSFV